jgi:hypothetical protein
VASGGAGGVPVSALPLSCPRGGTQLFVAASKGFVGAAEFGQASEVTLSNVASVPADRAVVKIGRC